MLSSFSFPQITGRLVPRNCIWERSPHGSDWIALFIYYCLTEGALYPIIKDLRKPLLARSQLEKIFYFSFGCKKTSNTTVQYLQCVLDSASSLLWSYKTPLSVFVYKRRVASVWALEVYIQYVAHNQWPSASGLKSPGHDHRDSVVDKSIMTVNKT